MARVLKARIFKTFLILVLAILGLVLVQPAVSLDFKKDRKEMVKELGRLGIKNENIIKAFSNLPRHKFAPNRVLREAYFNKTFSLGGGRRLYQPYELAKMIELSKPHVGKKVLQIGIGSGYEAAILSKLYSRVYVIETVKKNADDVQKRLKSMGIGNVVVKIGDPFRGIPEAAPFDAIIVIANPPRLPQPLVDQTKKGGSLVASAGSNIVFLKKAVSGGLDKEEYKVKKSIRRQRRSDSPKTGWKIKRKSRR